MGEEVAIVGAGIVGCATAYFLARAGASVTVLDPIGIAAGASGRNNGLIEHPYDAASLALFDETAAFLRELLGDAMPAQPVGALLLADDQGGAQGLLDHYARFPELEPALLTPEAARSEEPLLAAGLWGCMLQTGYPISPAGATHAVAELARQAGAKFVVTRTGGLRVTGSQTGGSGNHPCVISAAPDAATWQADTVVVAAGAASGSVLGGLLPADAVKPLWGVIVSIELPQRPRHPIIEGTVTRGLTTGRIENEAPFTLLDSPSWLAVGSTLLEGSEPRGEQWAPRLLERGTRFVPAIAQARVQGTLVCARPKSYDNRPILGRVPGHERLWIASGHGGRGMSLGVASGRLVAEAIMAGSDAAIVPELSARRLSA